MILSGAGLPRRSSTARSARLAAAAVALALAHAPAAPLEPPEPGAIVRLLVEGRYAEARERAAARLDRMRSIHGPDAIATAEALDLLVEARLADGDRTPELLALAERARESSERLLGSGDLRLAASVSNLAMAEREIRGDGARAREGFERAYALRREHLGEAHPDTLKAAALLGTMLREVGDFDEAARLLERGCGTAESAFGPDSVELSRLLSARGILRWRLDDLRGARADLERAVRIQEERLGAHPELALTINRLAVLEWAEGDYVEARRLYDRQLEIQERTLRPGHPDFGTTWLNMGLLLWSAGDLQGAKESFDRSRALAAHRESPDHPGRGYENYARLALEMGDYAEALAMMERNKRLRERLLRPHDPRLVHAYWDLGTLYRETGELQKARENLERALSLGAAVHGPEHTRCAEILRDLALLEERTGDLAAARRRIERALGIAEAALGSDHPMSALLRGELGRILWRQGDAAPALERSLAAAASHRRHLEHLARFFSERETLAAESRRLSALQVCVSILGRAGGDPRAARRLWEEVVRGRALVLDAIAARHRVALEADAPEVSALRGRLEAARRRLAHLFLRGPGQEDVEEYARRLRDAGDEKESLERRLAGRTAASGEVAVPGEIGFDELRAALPHDAALASFVEFEEVPVAAAGRAGERSAPAGARRRAYLGLVLRPDESDVAVVPLGDAAPIERAVDAWRAQVSVRPRGRSDVERYLEAGRRLRELVWDPIERHMGSSRLVLLVPEGALHLVAFATLPDRQGAYLVERRRFHYLSAERDLLMLAGPEATGRGLLVLGGADFDADPGRASVASVSLGSGPVDGAHGLAFRGILPACERFETLRFRPLPGSEAEALELAATYRAQGARGPRGEAEPVTILTGAEAGEGRFKRRAPGHRVLHLATHAFVIDADCPSSSARPGARAAPGGRPSQAVVDNPLLLSGIAFTSANHRDAAGLEGEDGVLTAEEAASLDLRGVEWAVLSGCETGLGRVQTGEGVLGLRRAFHVAGARTLVMSLWPLEDHVARQWFRHLYAARLGGDTTPAAIQRASLEVIERRRAAGATTHPFYWGAFVAAGDWR